MDKYRKIPWDMLLYKKELLMKDSTWVEQSLKTQELATVWSDINKLYSETHEYKDKDGSVLAIATIKVSKYEKRPYWFQWTKLFSKVEKYISVNFSKIGEKPEDGSVIAVDLMLKNETPLECYKRGIEKSQDLCQMIKTHFDKFKQ